MVNEKKEDRINVRATKRMKNQVKMLKLYLEEKDNKKYSDSDIIEIVLNMAIKNITLN